VTKETNTASGTGNKDSKEDLTKERYLERPRTKTARSGKWYKDKIYRLSINKYFITVL